MTKEEQITILHDYLDSTGMSNKLLAQFIGVSPQAVGSWLRGETNISRNNWAKIRVYIKPWLIGNLKLQEYPSILCLDEYLIRLGYDAEERVYITDHYRSLKNDNSAVVVANRKEPQLTVDQQKISLIVDFLERFGLTNKAFALEIGVSPSAVSKWLKGEKSISRKNWLKIKEFICCDDPLPPNREVTEAELRADGFHQPSPEYVYPVLTLASAAGFDDIFCPVDELYEDSSEQITFSTPPSPGLHALRIEGDSMEPMLPNGSFILIDCRMGKMPKTNQPCVVKLNTGEVMCKIWNWKNGIIKLLSINPEGQSFEWSKEEAAERIAFRYPVIETKVKYNY